MTSAKELYQSAQQEIASQNYEGALKLLEQSLAKELSAQALHDKAIITFLYGDPDKAIALLEQAVEVDPNYAQAYDNLASITYQSSGDILKAIEYTALAVNADPANIIYKENFVELASTLDVKFYSTELSKLILECLKTPAIEFDKLTLPWYTSLIRDPELSPLHDLMGAKDYEHFCNLIENLEDLSFLRSEFFIQGLGLLLIPDLVFETFLINLRRYLLCNSDIVIPSKLKLLGSLASYCLRTDYIFAVTDDESKLIEQMLEKSKANKLTADLIYMLGCYMHLANRDEIKSVIDQSDLDDHFYEAHISNPEEEDKLKLEISSLTEIKDEVSLKVQEQYEAFPYPRWKSLAKSFSLPIELSDENKDILIAGCGTGKEAIEFASAFPNSNILAIDMSLSSLAYGMRQAKLLDLNNVTFKQADILQLDKLDREFDLISSTGVLHHLKEPEKGWLNLDKLLKPSGYIHIGLYSRQARRSITAVQKLIKQKGYGDDLKEIRRFRADAHKVLNKKDFERLVCIRDFYTAPECRDLIFHVQEHCYTLKQIKDFLGKLDHRLIRFNLSLSIEQLYKQEFPEDNEFNNFKSLEKFEKSNPDAFITMYNFWSQKN